MLKMLTTAGLPKNILDMVPDIVDTCRECRIWQRPGKETQVSISVPTTFNEQVECDLMFYKKYIIFLYRPSIAMARGADCDRKTGQYTVGCFNGSVDWHPGANANLGCGWRTWNRQKRILPR